MYAEISSTGKINTICTVQVNGFEVVPDESKIGDYIKDGKVYTPPNGYSILSAVKGGAPIWTVDIEMFRTAKLREIAAAFDGSFLTGSFLSATLGIDVDCRRSGTKNDEQNVRGLISRMTREGIKEVEYKGKTESATATLAQIQSLQYEMEDYGASLYAKKWAAEEAIEAAESAKDIEKITW